MASSVTDRKRVYIACPISRPDTPEGLRSNVKQADAAMLSLMRLGFSPFNPALSVYAGGLCDPPLFSLKTFAFADRKANGEFQTLSHQDWLDMDFAWVAVSDAVLRLPGDSTGADMETAFATERGIPVYFSIEDLKSHFGGQK